MTPATLISRAKDFTAHELDQVIKTLADLRVGKEPAVPMQLKYGGPYNTIDGPRWNTQREVMEGKSLIHFRHPGFGWLHFALPPDEAGRLARHLQKQVELSSNQPDRPAAN